MGRVVAAAVTVVAMVASVVALAVVAPAVAVVVALAVAVVVALAVAVVVAEVEDGVEVVLAIPEEALPELGGVGAPGSGFSMGTIESSGNCNTGPLGTP